MANDIGNITASLKLESAAFIRELSKASQATARNTSAMRRQMAAAGKSFSAAGSVMKGALIGLVSVATIRALVNLNKTIVDIGDNIGTAAAKMGLGAEELQRLRYASEQADVEVGQLEAAFRKFQANVATGKIAAEGKTMGEAFTNFIQKIAAAPDLGKKTQIAMEGLGAKGFQTGILLAESGDKFKEWFDKAFVVSQKAVGAAGDLDIHWREFQNALSSGFQSGFLEQFVGQAGLSEAKLKEINQLSRDFGSILASLEVGGMKVIVNIAKGWNTVAEAIAQADTNIRLFHGENVDPGAGAANVTNRGKNVQFAKPGGPTPSPGAAIGEIGDKAAESAAKISSWKTTVDDAVTSQIQLGESLAFNTIGPMEQYRQELEALARAQEYGKITAEQMGAAQTMAAASAVQPWLSVADSIGGALGTLFKDNKAVAIAQAIINTAQGITAALAQYPPPLSFAMAAAQAAAGAAQIAAIKSTNPGSGGSVKKPSASGGSGKAASGGGGAPDRSVFIKLEGSSRFSREEVEGLIGQLIDAQKDGAKLVLSKT